MKKFCLAMFVLVSASSFAMENFCLSALPIAMAEPDPDDRDELRDLVFFLVRKIKQGAAITWQMLQDDCMQDDDNDYNAYTVGFAVQYLGGDT